MKPKTVAVKASKRSWVRMAGGAIGATLLLAVPALAMSFVDLKAFSQSAPDIDPALAATAFDSTTPAANGGATNTSGKRTPSMNSVVQLNDWTYTNGDSKNRDKDKSKVKTKTKTKTKKTKTKSPDRHTKN